MRNKGTKSEIKKIAGSVTLICRVARGLVGLGLPTLAYVLWQASTCNNTNVIYKKSLHHQNKTCSDNTKYSPRASRIE